MDSLITVSVLSMAGLAIIFASILAFADKKLKVEEDPKIDRINRLLPGVNCGGCEFVSCHDFAEHIVKEGINPAKCCVADEETLEKLFKEAGSSGEKIYPKVPLVHCAAEEENKKPAAEYKGIETCDAAGLVFGGGMQCQYGCMGFGDCSEACPFDALHMAGKLPKVDLRKCTGCGKCAEACPRKIIEMAEKRNKKIFYVVCSSYDDALRVREICGVGCIACGICEKLSPEKFFKVENDLSRRDQTKHKKKEKQEEIRKIADKCPTKVIKDLG